MNSSHLWLALAVVGTALVVAAVARYLIRLKHPSAGLSAEAAEEMARLPLTPLQKRARWSLLSAMVL